MKKRLVVTLGIAVLTLTFGFLAVAGLEPEIVVAVFDATRLRPHHRLVLLSAGLPAPWYGAYQAIIYQRYGVELEAAGGCTIGPAAAAQIAAHNAIVELEIERRFGKGALDKAARDAREYWWRQTTSRRVTAGSSSSR